MCRCFWAFFYKLSMTFLGLYIKPDGVFTLPETESDPKTMSFVKLERTVHTDRDPLIVEFHGVGIGLQTGLGQCE